MSKKNLIYVNEKSGIPLFGVDFLGIIDRGTNIIEIKPITICNLKCKYCFVSAGDYETNFIVDIDYLLKNIQELVKIKGAHDLEVHIAPYGEALLHPHIFELIKKVKNIKGIEIVSMQSNGILLSEDIIKKLEDSNLTRINISVNTFNRNLAEKLCGCSYYNIENMLKNIELLLESSINVLLAPVWFPGKNDKDIEDIIKYVIAFRQKGYSDKKIQLGIQKYLVYKTGRKLKNVRPKSWDYFYRQLSKLEKKYSIKLKLGPKDFGIHRRARIKMPVFQKGHKINIKIISKGRWNWEAIGKIDENSGIKVLFKRPLTFSENLIGKIYNVLIIKANYRDNIITSLLSI
ncbi:MAG: radical SAM protein [Promethearchaeia archaeon]